MYFSAGQQAVLDLPTGRVYHAEWFDPCTGEMKVVEKSINGGEVTLAAPVGEHAGHPRDTVLVLRCYS